jgi:hypothetical protein
MRRDIPNAPVAVHSPSGLKFLPLGKANVIAECLEIQFSLHDMCEENHERRVVACVQALSEAIDDSPERVRPCDVQKLLNSLKLKKACGIDRIPNECLRHIPRRPLVYLRHIFNHCLLLSHFPSSYKRQKRWTYQSRVRTQNSLNLRPVSPLSTTGKLFEKVVLSIVQRHTEENTALTP